MIQKLELSTGSDEQLGSLNLIIEHDTDFTLPNTYSTGICASAMVESLECQNFNGKVDGSSH